MFPLGTIARLGGIALIVFALAAPLAWCTVHTENARFELQKACFEAKGDGSPAGGGRCSWPSPGGSK